MSNFIVDGILDKKITNGTVYYKVKWAEHLPSSWERCGRTKTKRTRFGAVRDTMR